VRWLSARSRCTDRLVAVRIIHRVVTAGVDPSGFIGRSTELARLEAARARAETVAGTTIVIGGEAGIGKTRLIREFEAGLPDDVRLLAGQCVDLGSVAAPYAPVKTALRTLLAEVGAQRKLLTLQRDLAKTRTQLVFKPISQGAAP